MWIARDENEDLYMYSDKPVNKTDGKWNVPKWNTIVCKIDNILFPEVKYTDSEPKEFVLKLVNTK